MEIERFIDDQPSNHWDKDILNIYIFKDVFDEKMFSQVKFSF